MTANLVIWKWADEYQKPYARRKEGLTMHNVVERFMASNDESKFGLFDKGEFLELAKAELISSGLDADDVIAEQYEKCLVFNMGLAKKDAIIPLIGSLAMRQGLNGTEA